jgi:hypothetical protein
MEKYTIAKTMHKPVLLAYLQWLRLMQLAELAVEDAGRMRRAVTEGIDSLKNPPHSAIRDELMGEWTRIKRALARNFIKI